MKEKIAITILALIIAGSVYAQGFHSHAWIKDSEWYGQDSFGNQIKICSWYCIGNDGSRHTTQTSGQGFCSSPY